MSNSAVKTPMASARIDATTSAAEDHRKSLLKRFVACYWLRPENAYWMALRSMALSRVPLASPAIDLACGDGIFTFLHSGGAFDPSFDVFQSVAALDRVRSEHADMFDHAAEGYTPKVVQAPTQRMAAGLDAKPALLAKAAALGFYDRLIVQDGNRPLAVEEESFETVYCNAAYWIEDIDGFLRELHRVVRAGGRVILQVKLDSMRRYNLEAYAGALPEGFLDIIGRGRLDCWPSLTDRATWESRFAHAGLAVEQAEPFVTPTHARIWDVGLRPIAPLLVRMANALTPEMRTAIKSDWVDLFCELLDPICHEDFSLESQPDEPAEIQYVLARSS